MSNAITLPEPDGSAEANQRPHPGGGYEYDEVPAWSEPLVHAHAAAVTAAKDARIKELEDALKSFTKSTYIRHQHPRRFAAAVAALGDKNG